MVPVDAGGGEVRHGHVPLLNAALIRVGLVVRILGWIELLARRQLAAVPVEHLDHVLRAEDFVAEHRGVDDPALDARVGVGVRCGSLNSNTGEYR